MLLGEFLIPMGLSQRDLANAIRLPCQRVNDLVHGHWGMTPSTVLRLAKFVGTTPEFWMSLQLRIDLYAARQVEQSVLESISTYHPNHPLSWD